VSPALADLPFRKVNDALVAAGYRQVRVRGSHVVYRGPAGNVVVVRSTPPSNAARWHPYFGKPA
jgi:predicted RNA binding protein YcfA (HicA-like mRNA interferase family)